MPGLGEPGRRHRSPCPGPDHAHPGPQLRFGRKLASLGHPLARPAGAPWVSPFVRSAGGPVYVARGPLLGTNAGHGLGVARPSRQRPLVAKHEPAAVQGTAVADAGIGLWKRVVSREDQPSKRLKDRAPHPDPALFPAREHDVLLGRTKPGKSPGFSRDEQPDGGVIEGRQRGPNPLSHEGVASYQPTLNLARQVMCGTLEVGQHPATEGVQRLALPFGEGRFLSSGSFAEPHRRIVSPATLTALGRDPTAAPAVGSPASASS